MPLVITPKGIMNDSPLTVRERSILHHLSGGMQPKQIADELNISQQTVRKHLKNIYKKLGAHNTVQALRMAGMI